MACISAALGTCLSSYEFMCVSAMGLLRVRKSDLLCAPQLLLRTKRCHRTCCVTHSTCCHLVITSGMPLPQRILLQCTTPRQWLFCYPSAPESKALHPVEKLRRHCCHGLWANEAQDSKGDNQRWALFLLSK